MAMVVKVRFRRALKTIQSFEISCCGYGFKCYGDESYNNEFAKHIRTIK